MAASFPRPSIPIGAALMVLAACVAAAYAVVIVLMDAGLQVLGRDSSHLEPQLAAISLLGMVLVIHTEILGIGMIVLVAVAWRFVRRDFRFDWVVMLALAVMGLAASGYCATMAGHREARAHARAMEAAVQRGDRKGLREAVFRCQAFCGFQADSGPLVWLVSKAESDADINAIGRMLNGRMPRNMRSAWLADARTPIQAAVDRNGDMPALLWYVLGINSYNFHFQVGDWSAPDVSQALAYAMAKGAPPDVLDELRRKGGTEARAASLR